MSASTSWRLRKAMQAINNGPNPFHHDSEAWGLIQRQIQREREEAERIEAQKSDADRFHEEALRRFWERCDKPDQHMTFGR
jgi:hypothetical protein